MIIDTVALERGIRTEFNKAYHTAPAPPLDAIFLRVPSTGASEKYGWMGDVPTLREWLGDKHVKAASDHEYTLANKDWESTIGVDRNEIEDDQMGMIKPRIQMLSIRAKAYPARLVSDLVINGTTNLAYDGSAFFADRTAPNDNLLAGSGVTDANLLTDLAAARAAMMRFHDDNGEDLGIVPDTILCPPELEPQFQKLIASTTHITASAQGIANVWAGSIKRVFVDSRLSDANDWYVLMTDWPLKPFIYQERKKPMLVAMDKNTDTEVFMRKRLLYSVEMRGVGGYGFYQQAVKIVNT